MADNLENLDVTPITASEWQKLLVGQSEITVTIEGFFGSPIEPLCAAMPCFVCGGCSECMDFHFGGKGCTEATCPRFLNANLTNSQASE